MAQSEEKSEKFNVLDLVRQRSVAGRGGVAERLRLAAFEAQRQQSSDRQPAAYPTSHDRRNGSVTASSDPALRKVIQERASVDDLPSPTASSTAEQAGPPRPGAFSVAPSQRAVLRTPISKMDLSDRENQEETLDVGRNVAAVRGAPPKVEPGNRLPSQLALERAR